MEERKAEVAEGWTPVVRQQWVENLETVKYLPSNM